MKKTAEALFAFLTTLWLGLLLGVSFLATPVKFRAPSLDLPVALDVGRVTFELFSQVELALCVTIVLCIALLRPGLVRAIACGLIVAIVLVEAFWLLPVLDARISQIISGNTNSASNHHLLYVLGEAAKALLLLGLSIDSLRRLARTSV